MSDIVERLLRYIDGIQGNNELKVGPNMCVDVMHEAAAEIERLREALADIGMHGCAGRIDKDSVPAMIARAALKGQDQ